MLIAFLAVAKVIPLLPRRCLCFLVIVPGNWHVLQKKQYCLFNLLVEAMCGGMDICSDDFKLSEMRNFHNGPWLLLLFVEKPATSRVLDVSV